MPTGMTATLPLIQACGSVRKFGTMLSSLSWAYITQASWSCLRLLRHFVAPALALALLKAGNNIPARIAMIAMTTNSSIKVKPFDRFTERENVFNSMDSGEYGSLKKMANQIFFEHWRPKETGVQTYPRKGRSL